MAQIPSQMDVLHNQTHIDVVSDFQHNETNFIHNSNHSNFTEYPDREYRDWDWEWEWDWQNTQFIVYWIIFLVAYPGICFALHKLRSQIRPDQVAPVYVINMLISDLIQVCANPIQASVLKYFSWDAFDEYIHSHTYSYLMYLFGVQVNVFFMMFVSAERYVMIAHAVWYRHIHKRKISVIVSVIIWILSAVITFFTPEEYSSGYILWAVLLVPYPVVMFFFVATWRALSMSSVPGNDQIRIRAILGLILGIYTILFLPFIITHYCYSYSMSSMTDILIVLNPLFDLLLYVFIRRDVTHVWRTLLFCCNRGQGANGRDTAT